MKRIMHIAQAPGGVERYLYTLLNKLDKDKYENILVCSQNYNISKFGGVTSAIECMQMYREINSINEFKVVIHIRKLIKKYNPDIVYMHSSKAGATCRIASIGLKAITIYNAHGWAFNMKCSLLKKSIYVLIEKMLAPLCTQIVAISDYEKKSALTKHICKSNKIRVIYNGIDFDEYKENKVSLSLSQLGIPENAFVVGSVGRLDIQKAPDIFVKAAKIIKDKIPRAFFVMVGDGGQQDMVEKLINDFGLADSFLITGWVENPLEYIRKFDVAMLLSRWEGFGLVLPEYMLEGKPIVATRVDAIPDIITDHINGLLTDMDDYKAAAEAVIKIHDDECLTKLICDNGINCVNERFNADRVAREHEKLFDTLLS